MTLHTIRAAAAGFRQRFADGTVTDWTNGPQGIRPTAVTQLAPAASATR
jgi:hypothetical protein